MDLRAFNLHLKSLRKQMSAAKRFEKMDRVLCFIGLPDMPWIPGTIQSLDEEDPSDPTGRKKLPYVVKVDPPINRLISVPRDVNTLVTAERCFGQRAGALWSTMFAMPRRFMKAKRFKVGDRVVCAVEDDTDRFTEWKAGTVTDVNYSIEADAKTFLDELGDQASTLTKSRSWTKEGALVPYRVELESGCKVLVHRDEHWLVRDLELQAEAPRQAEDGTRNLKRLVKRKRGDDWELVDHTTRKVRKKTELDADSDDSDNDAD
jgi:hypothetical protein